MTEQSSPTSQTPPAFYDPESWSWRTSQASLLSAVPESLERLPAWGTTSNGALFELRTPERLTAGRDGSASPGLPTPVVTDMGAGKTVEAWDTWTDEMKARHGNGNGHGPSLSIELLRLLPTPTTVDSHSTGRTTDRLVGGDTKHLALREAVKLLPTPQHCDHKVFGPNVDWKKRAESHADSVASVLMNLPLNDGDEPLDGPHLTQLMIEGCDPDSLNG